MIRCLRMRGLPDLSAAQSLSAHMYGHHHITSSALEETHDWVILLRQFPVIVWCARAVAIGPNSGYAFPLVKAADHHCQKLSGGPVGATFESPNVAGDLAWDSSALRDLQSCPATYAGLVLPSAQECNHSSSNACRILKYAGCSEETFILALIYMDQARFLACGRMRDARLDCSALLRVFRLNAILVDGHTTLLLTTHFGRGLPGRSVQPRFRHFFAQRAPIADHVDHASV